MPCKIPYRRHARGKSGATRRPPARKTSGRPRTSTPPPLQKQRCHPGKEKLPLLHANGRTPATPHSTIDCNSTELPRLNPSPSRSSPINHHAGLDSPVILHPTSTSHPFFYGSGHGCGRGTWLFAVNPLISLNNSPYTSHK